MRGAAFKGTKAALLKVLKERRSATLAELAQEIGVTRVCVHGHMTDFEAAGLVSLKKRLIQGRGRPSHVYELSEAGENIFPKDYAGLACGLLKQIRERYGSKVVLELLRQRNQKTSEAWKAELSQESRSARLEGLTRRLSKLGYEAKAVYVDGQAWLTLANCPYAKVAKQFPELCAAETQLHQDVLGYRVQRDGPRIVDGGVRCQYRLLLESAMS